LTNLGNRVVRTLSVGYLRKPGLLITIRTSLGQRAAFEIARSLHSPHS
jgi:hypothetical protein